MAPTTLTDLPPELLDHITAYLPSAHSLTSLGAANRNVHTFVEKDGWQTFNRNRFPSLFPTNPPSHRDAARTLTTLSKSWDRRAFVARYIEPHGDIRACPGDQPVERWKRPRGQTIGFTPQLDVYEEVGPRWHDREETLAFSAGAEVCVRKKRRLGGKGDVRWMTYRPLSAFEGRDDITTLHLLKPEAGVQDAKQRLITGTANGDLWILTLPKGDSGDVPTTYFITQGHPVRSSSLLQRPFEPTLLAASLGDSRISVYPVDASTSKLAPLSSIDIRPPQPTNGLRAKPQRIWSTQFLSPDRLVAGLGPSTEPIHVYALTQSGLSKEPLRKFSLQNNDPSYQTDFLTLSPPTANSKKPTTSIYPILPLPPSHTAGSNSPDHPVFLSGAYDSIIRLHDLRSPRDVEVSYTDLTDDSAIYSLLARGQETLIAGTSRHGLLKVFDLRLGGKCYSYLDASGTAIPLNDHNNDSEAAVRRAGQKDWNLFLKPHGPPSTSNARRGGNNSSHRSREGSVYSLASPSPTSPFLYAGVESAVVELAFTSPLDPHPDPIFFPASWRPAGRGKEDPWRSRELLDLAMYDQSAEEMRLCTQRSLWETWRARQNATGSGGSQRTVQVPGGEGMDARWRVGSGPG